MKLKAYILFSLLILANSTLRGNNQPQTKNLLTSQIANSSEIQAGVSANLANQRHATVTDIAYAVNFNIPEGTNEPVTGSLTANFKYNPVTEGNLLFDFKAEPHQLHSLSVNGKTLHPAVINEHIVIPKEYLAKGENTVTMSFESSEKGINRRDGYVYTLFVPDRARCVFPCFDQPDMKASFTLSLHVPKDWKAVGNSYQTDEKSVDDSTKEITFAPTEPLSTYLFAFATGNFSKVDYEKDGRKISAYHRETDPDHISQLDDIFKDVANSLDWQERHTGIKYPFSKYDLVILPGFQFGGMEHTGATFYNDKSLFLPENPTPDEYLSRSSLIAHETSHMWFGDLVTMRWFDDVWTKEVFANYYAAQITRQLLPQFDHDIEWLRDYTAAAMGEDRSEGRTSIRQNLDNLQNAGLIYNNIIYNKAPVMLAKLVDLMGEDAYREGIREYVSTFSYANADWDELIEILSGHTDEDVKEFSRVWVYEKGMPVIKSYIEGDSLTVEQSDPYGKGNVWPQHFSVAVYDNKSFHTFDVDLKKCPRQSFDIKVICADSLTIVPNFDGKGYGRFTTGKDNTNQLLTMLSSADNLPPISRMSLMMTLYENYLAGEIAPEEWVWACLKRLHDERDPQMATTLVNHLSYPLKQLNEGTLAKVENELWDMAQNHSVGSCSTAILRLLANKAVTPAVREEILGLWEKGESPLLSEKDFMSMAYQLAVRYPEKDSEILSRQRERLTNPDRIAEFDYISRAAVADSTKLDALFESLKNPANRRIEPWTVSILSLLFHPLREEEARKHLKDALMLLPEVQQHGDIFYPANWSKAVLGGLSTKESLDIVMEVLDSGKFHDTLLRNKILNAAFPLLLYNR